MRKYDFIFYCLFKSTFLLDNETSKTAKKGRNNCSDLGDKEKVVKVLTQ